MLFIYAIRASATAATVAAVTASAARNKNEGNNNDPKDVVVVKKVAKAVHMVLLYNKIKLVFCSQAGIFSPICFHYMRLPFVVTQNDERRFFPADVIRGAFLRSYCIIWKERDIGAKKKQAEWVLSVKQALPAAKQKKYEHFRSYSFSILPGNSIAFLREEGGTRQGFPEANEMSFGGSLRSVTKRARVTSLFREFYRNALSLTRLRRELPPGVSLSLCSSMTCQFS